MQCVITVLIAVGVGRRAGRSIVTANPTNPLFIDSFVAGPWSAGFIHHPSSVVFKTPGFPDQTGPGHAIYLISNAGWALGRFKSSNTGTYHTYSSSSSMYAVQREGNFFFLSSLMHRVTREEVVVVVLSRDHNNNNTDGRTTQQQLLTNCVHRSTE